jgi:hypothetical protein
MISNLLKRLTSTCVIASMMLLQITRIAVKETEDHLGTYQRYHCQRHRFCALSEPFLSTVYIILKRILRMSAVSTTSVSVTHTTLFGVKKTFAAYLQVEMVSKNSKY